MSYDNTNSGALFKNKDKKTDSHPDYRGNLNVGGEEFFISAWLKTSKANEKYMSLSVTPKQPQQRHSVVPTKSAPEENPFDDDIPF